MAELVLRTQEHLSFKVLFFSEYTYHVVKDLVSEDYQQDSTIIDEEEDLEEYEESHPRLIGRCLCGKRNSI